jgi:hypothetical protein
MVHLFAVFAEQDRGTALSRWYGLESGLRVVIIRDMQVAFSDGWLLFAAGFPGWDASHSTISITSSDVVLKLQR